MRARSIAAMLAAGALWLVTATPAIADVTLDFQSAATRATVQAPTDPTVAVTLFERLDTNCGEGCNTYFEVRSPQRITVTTGSNGCGPSPSITDRTAVRCGRLPLHPIVTLTGGADTLQSIGSAGSSSMPLCPDPAVSAQGFGGADQLTGGCGADTLNGGDADDALHAGEGANRLFGGAGDDSLTAGGSGDELRGDAGADTLSAGGAGDVLDGAAGLDTMDGGPGDDNVSGGADKDTLVGGPGHDQLDGGDDGDLLDGGPNDDTLRGGDRRDVLIPGTGRDVVEGGAGVDTVLFDERGGGLTVTLDGAADDGEGGEGDQVLPDVENVVAGPSADRIVGSPAANDIDAGDGDDSIDPGGGVDGVQGGAGNDRIFALDGVQNRVDCGNGFDTATVDALDATEGCESVTASRELMSDVDNDGLSVAAGDCNDRDPALRLGLPDIPENGINEDCIGADALFPRVLATVGGSFARRRSRARVTALVANDVPDSAAIEIRCTGGGCFKGTRGAPFPNGKRRANLMRYVRRLRLRRGGVLEVRILRDQTIGRVFRFTVKKSEVAPTARCLRPGATKVTRCPRA